MKKNSFIINNSYGLDDCGNNASHVFIMMYGGNIVFRTITTDEIDTLLQMAEDEIIISSIKNRKLIHNVSVRFIE